MTRIDSLDFWNHKSVPFAQRIDVCKTKDNSNIITSLNEKLQRYCFGKYILQKFWNSYPRRRIRVRLRTPVARHMWMITLLSCTKRIHYPVTWNFFCNDVLKEMPESRKSKKKAVKQISSIVCGCYVHIHAPIQGQLLVHLVRTPLLVTGWPES